MSDDTILIRLKPFNRKLGHVLRSLTVYSMRFREKNGWYEVEKEVAEMVKDMRQPPIGDRPPESMPLAFDVMSKEQAEVHEEEERKKREKRAKAISPHKMKTSKAASSLTTKDLAQEEDTVDEAPEPKKASTSRRSSRGKSSK